MNLKDNQKHAMIIQNPQFWISESLRSMRKLKRSGQGSMADTIELQKVKVRSKSIMRMSTLAPTSPHRIDMTEDAQDKTSKKGSIANFMNLKFNSKRLSQRPELVRIPTRNSQVSLMSKKKMSMTKLNTIGIFKILIL